MLLVLVHISNEQLRMQDGFHASTVFKRLKYIKKYQPNLKIIFRILWTEKMKHFAIHSRIETVYIMRMLYVTRRSLKKRKVLFKLKKEYCTSTAVSFQHFHYLLFKNLTPQLMEMFTVFIQTVQNIAFIISKYSWDYIRRH